MNALRQVAFLSFGPIDAALCIVFLLCGLNVTGQLVMKLPVYFVRNLLPRGSESPLVQHILVGFVITLIVGLMVVVAMLRRELREDAA